MFKSETTHARALTVGDTIRVGLRTHTVTDIIYNDGYGDVVMYSQPTGTKSTSIKTRFEVPPMTAFKLAK